MKRFGKSPKNGRQYTHRPGVYVILARGDRVLLTFQGGEHQEYQLPGGGIDPGESPIQALHREDIEETGWRIAAPRRLGVFKRFSFMPEYKIWAEKIAHIYVAKPIYPLCEATEEDHTAVWVDLDDAADLVSNKGDAAFVRAFADKQRLRRPRRL